MKAIVQLRQALDSLAEELSFGVVDKEKLAEKTGHLIGVLEVFTDKNFDHKEQEKLFNIASERLHQVEQEVK